MEICSKQHNYNIKPSSTKRNTFQQYIFYKIRCKSYANKKNPSIEKLRKMQCLFVCVQGFRAAHYSVREMLAFGWIINRFAVTHHNEYTPFHLNNLCEIWFKKSGLCRNGKILRFFEFVNGPHRKKIMMRPPWPNDLGSTKKNTLHPSTEWSIICCWNRPTMTY